MPTAADVQVVPGGGTAARIAICSWLDCLPANGWRGSGLGVWSFGIQSVTNGFLESVEFLG